MLLHIILTNILLNIQKCAIYKGNSPKQMTSETKFIKIYRLVIKEKS